MIQLESGGCREAAAVLTVCSCLALGQLPHGWKLHSYCSWRTGFHARPWAARSREAAKVQGEWTKSECREARSPKIHLGNEIRDPEGQAEYGVRRIAGSDIKEIKLPGPHWIRARKVGRSSSGTDTASYWALEYLLAAWPRHGGSPPGLKAGSSGPVGCTIAHLCFKVYKIKLSYFVITVGI